MASGDDGGSKSISNILSSELLMIQLQGSNSHCKVFLSSAMAERWEEALGMVIVADGEYLYYYFYIHLYEW